MKKPSLPEGVDAQQHHNTMAVRDLLRLVEDADNLREHCAAGARLSWRALCALQDAISHAEQAYRMADETYGDWQQSTGLKRPCESSTTTVKEGDK